MQRCRRGEGSLLALLAQSLSCQPRQDCSLTCVNASRTLLPSCTQAKDVAHLPWALVGTVGASTVLYVMLAVAMVYLGLPNVAKPMLPPDEPYLTFASAFNSLQGVLHVLPFLCSVPRKLT